VVASIEVVVEEVQEDEEAEEVAMQEESERDLRRRTSWTFRNIWTNRSQSNSLVVVKVRRNFHTGLGRHIVYEK